MKKYIAGFRSNNSKKKKKASIYYFLTTLLFLLGTSKDISDISLYLLLLMTPSLVCNFKAFIKKINSAESRKVRPSAGVLSLRCSAALHLYYLVKTGRIKLRSLCTLLHYCILCTHNYA